MTDGDNQDFEPGSTLPVPPSCDGHSPESEETSQGQNRNDDQGDVDWFALGESLDGPELECGAGEQQDRQCMGDHDVEPVFEHKPHDHNVAATVLSSNREDFDHERTLNESESRILDSMVNQAMLSASLDDGLELPWERGVMACIFGDEPLAAVPKIPDLAHNLDDRKIDRERSGSGSLEPQAKRQRVCNTSLRLYERVIRFKNNLTDHEADEAKWNRAIEKLYAVILSSPGVVPDGVRFQEGHMDLNFRQLRTLCGSRSPNTVAKRVNCLAKYCVWHKGFFYRKYPFPLDSEDVAEYIWEKHQDGMPYSAMTSFLEAANFAVHVLGLPLKRPDAPLVAAFTKGILDTAAKKRPVRKQARPLRVAEVVLLEEILGNDALDIFDRYAAGAFLFAVYARCRWSDLRSIHGCELDVDFSNGKLVGFISFSTFSHKTSSQVARHGLPMPLIAPIWGLRNPPWAMTWKKVAEAVSLDFATFGRGAVLPSPNRDGKWSQRSVTSDEASRWLVELLKPHSVDVEDVSSHSLKATTLSWLAKAGSDPHHRTILGHHSTGKGSLEVYSRDMLSAPLRTLEEMLRQIRIGALHPDLTRSGHIQQASKPDCKDAPDEAAPERSEEVSEDSSSSSSSSTTSSSDEDENEEEQWLSLGGADPNVRHSAWGDFNMYQHEASKIVHVEADSETCTFKCGMKATAEHKLIMSTAFLDIRKCKRCVKAVENSG